MAELSAPLDRFTVPLGGQEIALQQVDHAAGGLSLLRVRIREGKRFTVFDIDPESARRWAEAMAQWAAAQAAASPPPG
jgi:hypothetical protein